MFKFIEYDKKNCLPKIINKWPEVKDDNNILSRKIKNALGKWAEDKEKNLTYKKNYTIGINLPGFNDINNSNNIINKENENNKLFIDNNNEIHTDSHEDSSKNTLYKINKYGKKEIELKEI